MSRGSLIGQQLWQSPRGAGEYTIGEPPNKQNPHTHMLIKIIKDITWTMSFHSKKKWLLFPFSIIIQKIPNIYSTKCRYIGIENEAIKFLFSKKKLQTQTWTFFLIISYCLFYQMFLPFSINQKRVLNPSPKCVRSKFGSP